MLITDLNVSSYSLTTDLQEIGREDKRLGISHGKGKLSDLQVRKGILVIRNLVSLAIQSHDRALARRIQG